MVDYEKPIRNAIKINTDESLRDAITLCKGLIDLDQVEVLDGRGYILSIKKNSENLKKALGLIEQIRHNILTMLKSGNGSAELEALYWDTYLTAAPYDFDSYCLYLERNRPPEKKFYAPRRKVLYPLVEDLQRLYDGELDFLGVSLPPRVGKSTLCIFFISWVMGNRPGVANVMSGHSDKLTKGFYQEVLNILTDKQTYAWHDVFPGVSVVNKSANDESIDLERRKRFPTFTARAIGATLTGAVEIGTGGCLYVDDIIEDLEEALNQDRLDAKYDAYLNQLKDRKKDGAFELMVGTRWNVFDPLGRIQRQYDDNPRYKFDVIPAVDEEGHSNFNYPYNLGFSDEYYADMKASIDDSEWQAKYLGTPYIRDGILYEREKLRRYYELPLAEPDAIWAVCDPAQGGGDFTFMPVFYQYGDDHYLVDCVCSDALPEVTDVLCAEMLVKYKVRQCQFEVNAAGGRTADKVHDLLVERGGITKITKRHTQANKDTKILSNSTWVKEHILFKDDKVIVPKSGYSKAMTFLCMYAYMGKNKHDDVPDGLAQYALFVINMLGTKIEIYNRHF